MRCLLIYDIPDDRLRTKIADACLDYGLDRIQYSAFSGDISRNHQEELFQKATDILGKREGNIQLIPVCGKDWLIPVDYKHARREGAHFRLQLMAYGRLLETADPKSELVVKRGFLYLIPGRTAVEVRFTPRLRQQLETAVRAMSAIAQRQQMPPPTRQRRRCLDCEFRRFCNDIL